jgi:16S rRNA (cytidine1402-2'-O)-methyltransferase
MSSNFGELYIVATPIGNLEDMTMRAVRILKEVNVVFAEDTRTTGILFKHYGIENKLISYNAQNHFTKNKEIIKLLEEGKNVALVSDAGTPGVSDPGYSAVSEVRKNLPEVKVVPIPGASALTAFVSAVGKGTHAWTFYGFLPHKNGRQKHLKEMLASEKSSIFYESTHRIVKCLEEIKILGEGREVVVGKELTKIFEDFLIGTPEDILKIFEAEPVKTKGEFVVMIV